MAELSNLFFINTEDYSDHIVEPPRPLPIIMPSRATLEALENISRNSTPLVGFAHPNRRPIPSCIRDAWQLCDQTLQLRELVAGSSPIPLQGNPDFGPIQRLVPVSSPTPTISPMQSDEEPLEWDIYAPIESGPKQRHNSFFPPTPALSPIDDGGEPTELTLGKSTASSIESEAEGRLDADGRSNIPQVYESKIGREALGKTLRSIRNRRPRQWSDTIPAVIARGELESLMDIMGLADRGGIEY
jgi:hypothetical protein